MSEPAADSANREVSRLALATRLSPYVVGDDKPVVEVFANRPPTFNGRGPWILILSAGSKRRVAGMGTKKYWNYFRFQICVLLPEVSTKTPTKEVWTSDQIESALDLTDKLIADFVADNQRTDDWAQLEFDEVFSQIGKPRELGAAYLMEARYVLVRVKD